MASTKIVARSTLFSMIMALVFAAGASNAGAQERAVYTGYKGILIGTGASAVREKFGKARDQTDTEDYWEFSDDESARVLYDDKKKVRAISVNFSAKQNSTPTPEAVFGHNVEAKPDGSIFKIIQYPKDGFWISYVRTAGDDAMVIVTMQKIQKD